MSTKGLAGHSCMGEAQKAISDQPADSTTSRCTVVQGVGNAGHTNANELADTSGPQLEAKGRCRGPAARALHARTGLRSVQSQEQRP